ncbi:unnamed protein product, partial [Dibothriocephalus latus]
VLSGPKKFNWSGGQAACASALASVSQIYVGLPEVHNDSETNALIDFLVRVAVKEKIWLGAKREGPTKQFVWNHTSDVAVLDFVPWSGGLGLGDCIIFFYENQRSKSEWKNVPRLNNVGCDENYAVVCSHRGNAPVIDSTLTRGTYRCTGTRDPAHPKDPAYFRTQFVYSGIPLQFCEGRKLRSTAPGGALQYDNFVDERSSIVNGTHSTRCDLELILEPRQQLHSDWQLRQIA